MWLSILRTGRKAYGVDEPLLVYRIAKSSKSGNKAKAAVMNWNTYRYVGLNPVAALYYECCYMINGVVKYINLKESEIGA
jgi:teichuronic acid biosynthesis glycosyltransferase TuaG